MQKEEVRKQEREAPTCNKFFFLASSSLCIHWETTLILFNSSEMSANSEASGLFWVGLRLYFESASPHMPSLEL
ncbi:hypothetical protein IHE45_06G090100 [Dioscorea alata]|uniref:Uncharacterized protein n=1 Tax=Dioscorea alata TaxID=55571 RepID=A0ACB7VYZ3_DIOAL|nr:hypothetical protein IHE45_06G090100 [Dioscorea alata]